MNVNRIKMTTLEMIIKELVSQEMKMQQAKIEIDTGIKQLKERLAQGLKIAHIKRILHEKLTWYIASRMPAIKSSHVLNIPLPTNADRRMVGNEALSKVMAYECLNHEQSKNIKELNEMLEAVEKKHKKWQKFNQYNIENFTILDQYGVTHNSPTQYIDELGRIHDTPLQFMTDNGIIYDDLHLRNASNIHLCRFVGHTRRRCKANCSLRMKRHKTSSVISTLEKELSSCINTCTWEEKRRIQLEQQITYLKNANLMQAFTRIERACMATTVNDDTTEGELDRDETRAALAAI
jgi:hypothetical protein